MHRFCRLKRKRTTTFRVTVNNTIPFLKEPFSSGSSGWDWPKFQELTKNTPRLRVSKEGLYFAHFLFFGRNMQMCTCLSPIPAILTCQLTILARMHCFWSLKKMTIAVNTLINYRLWGRVSRDMMKFNQRRWNFFRFTASLIGRFFFLWFSFDQGDTVRFVEKSINNNYCLSNNLSTSQITLSVEH